MLPKKSIILDIISSVTCKVQIILYTLVFIYVYVCLSSGITFEEIT